MRGRMTPVAVVVIGVVALVTAGTVVMGWRLVDGIRQASADATAGSADAVLVFAGEDRRFQLGRQLVGEAAAFAALASERGWQDVIAVTRDHHAERASMLL